ncbi:MAG: hypothetical protein KDD43_12850, partial [Bdellovibrionales bacterium]|nr:hypothetical protein [Bdellovibrionales bacterium]
SLADANYETSKKGSNWVTRVRIEGKRRICIALVFLLTGWLQAFGGTCRPLNVSPGMVDQLLAGHLQVDFTRDPALGEVWIEALLPKTRGIGLSEIRGEPEAGEVVKANEWIKKISESSLMAPVTTPGLHSSFVWLSSSRSSAGWAKKVKLAPVVSVKRLGGGTNGVYRVTQLDASGKEFHSVFKPLGASRPVQDAYYQRNAKDFLRFLFHVREVRAESLYGRILQAYWRHGGQAPIHLPETLEAVLVFEGKSYGVGSLQKWAMGTEVESIRQSDPTRFAFWRGTQRWQEMESVVRVLDYIFGNSDRFPKKDGEESVKNIFVEMGWMEGREVLRRANLIDNGLGLPGHRDYTIDQIPIGDHVPWTLKKALHEVIGQEMEIRREQEAFFPREGLDEVFRRWREVINRYPI